MSVLASFQRTVIREASQLNPRLRRLRMRDRPLPEFRECNIVRLWLERDATRRRPGKQVLISMYACLSCPPACSCSPGVRSDRGLDGISTRACSTKQSEHLLPCRQEPRNDAARSPGLSRPARCCYRDKRSEFIVGPRERLELQIVAGPQRPCEAQACMDPPRRLFSVHLFAILCKILPIGSDRNTCQESG